MSGHDHPGATTSPFCGRDHDLGVVDSFLMGPPGRSPSVETRGVLAVRGEPGIGKSLLLSVSADRAGARGARVLRASGIGSERGIELATLTQLLGPVQDDASALSSADRSVLRAALDHADPYVPSTARVAGAVSSLLLAVAARSDPRDRPGVTAPLVAVIDDVHLVDRPSAAVLEAVVDIVDPRTLRVLVSERVDERTFFDTARHRRHTLGPLSDAAASQVLRSRFSALPVNVCARVIAEADGNPLALLELAAALHWGHDDSGRALQTQPSLSHRSDDLFGGRVRQLPPETRRLLLSLALDTVDEPPPLRLRSEHLRVLAPAERAGLVAVDRREGRVAFQHPLVRTVLLATSTSQERRRAHRGLAARRHPDDEQAAWHLAAATVLPDDEVAALLEATVVRTRRRGDAAGGVRGLVRAAQLSSSPGSRSRRFAEAAYQCAAFEGDVPRATTLLTEARICDPAAPTSLQVAVATAYLLLHGSGDARVAHQVLVDAMERADASTVESDVYSEALQTLAQVCCYAADPRLWPRLEAALSRLDPEALPGPALWTRMVVGPLDTARAALPDLLRSLDHLAHERDAATIVRVAHAAQLVDRVASARRPLQRVVAQARRGDTVTSGVEALSLLSLQDFGSGHWARACESADEGLRLASTHGLSLLTWPLRLSRALVAAGRGDHQVVRATADQMHSWAAPRGLAAVQHHAHWVTGLDALGRGDYEAAYRSLRDASPPGLVTPQRGVGLWAAMDLVEAAVNGGHGAAALAHVTALKRADVGGLSTRLELVVAGSEAMATGTLEPGLFERALALPAASRWPFERARIQLSFGQRLRRARSAADARPHLAAAAETFATLGAVPWGARAQEELGATGRTKRPSPVARPALTAQERRIAVLAAEGRTNKEIGHQLLISPRTVGAHLYHVFDKLDVTSRAGLHRALETAVGSRS